MAKIISKEEFKTNIKLDLALRVCEDTVISDIVGSLESSQRNFGSVKTSKRVI